MICSKCGTKHNGGHRYCRDCKRKYSYDYYHKNKDKIREQIRQRSSKDSVKYNRYVRERLTIYGLTEQDMRDMMDRQQGCCNICGNSLDSGKKGVAQVDHCHITGKVRALLCDICNIGLGHFKDNPNLLRGAAAYVEFYSKG